MFAKTDLELIYPSSYSYWYLIFVTPLPELLHVFRNIFAPCKNGLQLQQPLHNPPDRKDIQALIHYK